MSMPMRVAPRAYWGPEVSSYCGPDVIPYRGPEVSSSFPGPLAHWMTLSDPHLTFKNN